LMKRYEGRLLAYIKRLSACAHEEAQDILQEVFLKVYQNLNGFDQKLKFSSWIYRITHNEVISNFRKKQSRPKELSWDISPEALNKFTIDFSTDQELNNEMLRKHLMLAIDKLPTKYQEVIILKYFEQQDYSEISDILKKPTGTIAALLNRAKKQLKEILAKEKNALV
jgi:RNA polymerase sigma-70 factor, ECF subfamily